MIDSQTKHFFGTITGRMSASKSNFRETPRSGPKEPEPAVAKDIIIGNNVKTIIIDAPDET